MKRVVTTFVGLVLAGCAVPAPVTEQEETPTPSSGQIIGEYEVMPETIESLETGAEKNVIETVLTASGEIIQGDTGLTRLRIVTDFTCGYCHEFVTEYLPMIQRDYVQTGRLAIEWILVSGDATSELRAKIALCSIEDFESVTRNLYRTTPNAYPLSCVRSAETVALLAAHKERAATLGIGRVPGFELNGHTWLGVSTKEGLVQEIESGL